MQDCVAYWRGRGKGKCVAVFSGPCFQHYFALAVTGYNTNNPIRRDEKMFSPR